MAPNTKVKALKKQVAVESHSLPAEAVEWTEGTAARAIPAQDQVFTFDVAIVGLGYVGLPTALAINASGRRVLGLDVSERRLAVIREQQADLLDSDKERLKTALLDPSFMLTSDLSLLAHAAAVVVCVPTPVDEYLVPDLGILRAACASVVEYAVPGQLLMLTSTTYVGTTRDLLAMPLAAKGLIPGRDVYVAFSPERINPGVDSFSHEDVPRVVGGVTAACGEAAERLLSASTKLVHVVPSADAAEMTKLVENTFRAVNIALANEFAQICHELDMEVMDVINAAATKPYGFMPFTPGPGSRRTLHSLRPALPAVAAAQGPRHGARDRAGNDRDRGQAAPGSGKGAADPLRAEPRPGRRTGDGGGRGLQARCRGPQGIPGPRDHRRAHRGRRRGGLLGSVVPHRAGRQGRDARSPIPHPQLWEADLVILHTRHSQTDLDWLENAAAVLDTTYRLPKADNVTRL